MRPAGAVLAEVSSIHPFAAASMAAKRIEAAITAADLVMVLEHVLGVLKLSQWPGNIVRQGTSICKKNNLHLPVTTLDIRKRNASFR
jgi:hypothetical protein